MRRAAAVMLWLMLATPAAQASVDDRVRALMARMTLDEKIGQLHQVSVKNIDSPQVPGGPKPATAAVLDDIRQGRTGSLINVKGAADTRRMQALAMQSRLKIPLLFSLDVIHGYKTIFPIPLAESASWDLAAMEQTAYIAAKEAAASGLHWTFAPMVDIARDPRWGRIMEGAGEDTYLASLVAAARVRGFQGPHLGATDRLLACAKHFAAYGAAIGGHDYYGVEMSEQQLHESYLPPFKAALDAGAATFMNAFSTLNGIPATGDAPLQRGILKGHWKFSGFTVSDWDSIPEMVAHGYASDNADAAIKAINAGSDMDMEGKAYTAHLAAAVKAGKVTMAVIDDAVARILRKKFELGLFDDPYKFSDLAREQAVLQDPAHAIVARDMARKSMVLLKNDNATLPLRKDLGSIAIIGPLADSRLDMQGAWSNLVKSNLADVVTLAEGVRRQVSPGTRVTLTAGCDVACERTDGFAEAVAAAQQADVVVLALGESARMTGESRSRADITLPGKQAQLFQALKATGKPVIAVMMAGRPIIFNEVADAAPAILFAWFGGNQSGNAISDILFGDYNPAGRLTVSFPRSVGQIPVAYQQLKTGKPVVERKRKAYMDVPNGPRYAFGHGLSYTEFSYSGLALSAPSLAAGGTLTLSFDLRNTGKRDGEEVVQLYLQDVVASVARPIKELKGFQKVALRAGESRRISFEVNQAMLSFFNRELAWVAEPGAFKLMIGSASDDIKLNAHIELLPKKVLFFSKSSNYEHPVIKEVDGQPSFAARMLAGQASELGIEFTFSKDGSKFSPAYLAQFDAFMFYTSGDLLAPGRDGNPPMTAAGKASLLDAIRAGKGFIGVHSAADTFHTGESASTDTSGPRTWRYRDVNEHTDPYTRMLGGELIIHGTQQFATMRVADAAFPGMAALAPATEMMEEWYSLGSFARDMHVLLVHDTAGMRDPNADGSSWPPAGWNVPYQRPPYPSTWARLHGQGRVFYTAMGHDEAMWRDPRFQQLLAGGLLWATRQRDAGVAPNFAQATPAAAQLPPVSAPVPGLPKPAVFNGQDQFTEVPDSGSAKSWTIWVHPASVDRQAIVGKPVSATAWTRPRTGLYFSDFGTAAFDAFSADQKELVSVTGKTPIAAEAWTFIAVTHDGQDLRLYVDGRLDATQPWARPLGSTPGPMRLGAMRAFDKFYRGKLGAFRLHDRTLAQDELAAMHLAGRSTYPATAPSASAAPPGIVMEARRNASDTAWSSFPAITLDELAGFRPGAPVPRNIYGGRKDRHAEARGYFYAKKIGERWWAIDPEGGYFFHNGIVAVTPGSSATLRDHFARKFGSDAAWTDHTVGMLKEHGFTGAGAWSSVPLLRASASKLPYTVMVNFMESFARQKQLTRPGVGHTGFLKDSIPVFHPDFPAFSKQYARDKLQATRDDPWLFGIFSDNELLTPDLAKFLTLDPQHPDQRPSYEAARDWLVKATGKADAGPADVTWALELAFAGYAFERYFEIVSEAIRQVDRNHLYLGSRLNTERDKINPHIWRAAGKHVDVIALNLYRTWTPDQDRIADWTRWSGKPVIITEWYTKGDDVGLPNTTGAGWIVRTQADRGKFYQQFVLNLIKSRGIVGWHWFKYMDNDPADTTAEASNRDSNKGIMQLNYAPYAPLLERMKAVNDHMYRLADYFDKP